MFVKIDTSRTGLIYLAYYSNQDLAFNYFSSLSKALLIKFLLDVTHLFLLHNLNK